MSKQEQLGAYLIEVVGGGVEPGGEARRALLVFGDALEEVARALVAAAEVLARPQQRVAAG